jgi:hypothetical protein
MLTTIIIELWFKLNEVNYSSIWLKSECVLYKIHVANVTGLR